MTDLYSVLGVPCGADDATIRAAYRMLAKKYHPDSAKTLKTQATQNFHQITAAYDTLRTAERRAQYDLKRAREQDDDRIRREKVAHTLREAEERFRRAAPRRSRPFEPVHPAPESLTDHKANTVSSRRRLWLAASTAVVLILVAICLDWSPINTPATARRTAGAGSAQHQLRYAGAPKGDVYNSHCIGDDGVAFSITNQNGLLSIAYAEAAPVHPQIEAQGDLTVLRVTTAGGSRIDIGIFKDDKDGVVVNISDVLRHTTRTIGAKCSSRAL